MDTSLEVKSLISENRIEEAIEVLFSNNITSKEVRKSLLLLKSDYSRFKSGVINNQLSNSEISIEQSLLTSRLITLVDTIYLSQDKVFEVSINKNGYVRKLRKEFIYIPIFLIFLVFFLFRLGCSSSNKVLESSIDWDSEVTRYAQEDFYEVYPLYRDSYLRGVESGVGNIRRDANKIILKLESISDDEIEIYSKIYKYIGMAMSYKILALLAENDQDALNYSNLMLDTNDKIKSVVEDMSEIEDIDYRNQLLEWYLEENHDIRVRIIDFLGKAINFKAGGLVSKNEVIETFKELNKEQILEKHNYHIYPIVQWVNSQL